MFCGPAWLLLDAGGVPMTTTLSVPCDGEIADRGVALDALLRPEGRVAGQRR